MPKHAISIGAGGLSGPTLFDRALEMVKLLKPLNVPLIATGGIDNADKIKQCLAAETGLVGMAAALLWMFRLIQFNKQLRR